MSTLREAAQQALETLEALSAAENIIWVQKRAEIEVEHLRAALAQEEQATGKDSFTVDWMKQALTVVWNFPSHPGFHPADSSADQDGEDPTSAWRAGWIAAVGAMQDAVRHMTPDPQEQAEQAQEPVAWMVYTLDGKSVCVTDNPADFAEGHRALPLYTHPPRREWKGLTDEEIWELSMHSRLQFARAIEQALKERNHG